MGKVLDIYKSDAQGRVRGEKLSISSLKGEVGDKLVTAIYGNGADKVEDGRVEIDGHWFCWFVRDEPTAKLEG